MRISVSLALFCLLFTCEVYAASAANTGKLSVSESYSQEQDNSFNPPAISATTVKATLSATINLTGLASKFDVGSTFSVTMGNYSFTTVLGSNTTDKFVAGKSLTAKRSVGGRDETITVKYSSKSIGVKVALSGKNVGNVTFDLPTSPGGGNVAGIDLSTQIGAVTTTVPCVVTLGNIESKFTVNIASAAPKRGSKVSGNVALATLSGSIKGSSATATIKAGTTSDIFTGVKMGSTIGTFNAGFFPTAAVDSDYSVLAGNQVIRNGSLMFQALAPAAPDKIIVGVAGEPGYYELPITQTALARRSSEACCGSTKYSAVGQGGAAPAAQQVFTLQATISDTLDLNSFNLLVGFSVNGVVHRAADHTLVLNPNAHASQQLQVSLNFPDLIDLDLHVQTPDLNDIYYGSRTGQGGGTLDLDSNPACNIDSINNENITFVQGAPCGHFVVRVDLWSSCQLPGPFTYVVTVVQNGVTTAFNGTFNAGDADMGSALSGVIVTEFDVSNADALVTFSKAADGPAGNVYGYDDFDTPDNFNDDHVSVKAGGTTNVNVHVSGCANVLFLSLSEATATFTAPGTATGDFLLPINGVAAGETTIEAHMLMADGSMGPVIGSIFVDCYKEQAIAEWDVYRVTDSTSPATQNLNPLTSASLDTFSQSVVKQAVIAFQSVNVSDKDIPYDLNKNGILDYYYDGGATNPEYDVLVGAGLTGDPKIVIVKGINFAYRLSGTAKKGQRTVKIIGNVGNFLAGFATNPFTIGAGATQEAVTIAAVNDKTVTLTNDLVSDHVAGEELITPGVGVSGDPQIVLDSAEVANDATHETLHRPNVGNLSDLIDQKNIMYYTTGAGTEMRFVGRAKRYNGGGIEKQWDTIPRP